MAGPLFVLVRCGGFRRHADGVPRFWNSAAVGLPRWAVGQLSLRGLVCGGHAAVMRYGCRGRVAVSGYAVVLSIGCRGDENVSGTSRSTQSPVHADHESQQSRRQLPSAVGGGSAGVALNDACRKPTARMLAGVRTGRPRRATLLVMTAAVWHNDAGNRHRASDRPMAIDQTSDLLV